MTLFPLITTKITLPDLKIKEIKIGNNKLIRYAFIGQKVEVEVYESDYRGWYEIRTKLSTPYNRVYLHKPRARPMIPKGVLCLKVMKTYEIEDINETHKLKWVQHPEMNNNYEPDDIISSWTNIFQFREDRPELNQIGLRKPQLGALHAISAYFSLKGELEPATVVLPTGTGKTEVMLASMVYRQLPRVLILVPSNSLRNQISEKFYCLGILSKLELIPIDTAWPYVAVIKSGVNTIQEADELLNTANVLVATPNVLNSSNQDAIDHLCDGINDLFIDEAHHISALTWTKVRDRFNQKRVVQFTATPFRNDGNALGGRIIYNYTMGEAQEAEYFRHINLIPVEEYYIDEGDRSIAETAIKQLKADIDQGNDHLLMARVEEKSRADNLLPLYQKLSPDLNPIVVHSGMSRSEIDKALSALFSRESRIIICVKMLGEGFDLPNLKVAAIHDIHKSLAITLQFIGRFTRQSKNVGDASAIVNVAESEVENGLQQLYAQGADWDRVLKRLSDRRIKREIRLQEIVEKLKEKGNLHRQLSLWNLRPSCSSVLFKTTCDKWLPERFSEAIPENTEHWYSISEDENLLVVLAIHEARVTWGKYKDLCDCLYKLLIVHWDENRRALFIYSNDYRWFRVERAAKLICDEQCELLSGPKVFNVFNGLKYPLVRNLGASQIGAISFTQYFGPNVTEGLNRIESSKSNLSNLAGLGYDNGERVIWGCSQKKGKIWSVNSGSISDWMDWAKIAWDKVIAGDIDEANITRDFLRPERITAPYNEHAVAIMWGEHIQADPEDRVTILFGEKEVPLYLIDLKILSQGLGQPYHIEISSDSGSSVYEFKIQEGLSGGFSYSLVDGIQVGIRRGAGPVKPIQEYLQSDPWIIQYVDGSFSYNCFLIRLPSTIGEFDTEMIDCWDWKPVNIQKESMGRARDKNTVQWMTFKHVEDSYDVLINDDGKGEAADLVGLKIVDDEIHLGLIHCKYSVSRTPGARVGDLYEVCGQAQKSIRWKHAGIARLYGHLRHREEIWKNDGDSRFLKGAMPDLANIKRRARTAPIKLEVFIVQPGLRKDIVTSDMLRIIGGTALYLKNTAQADLVVVGSVTQ